jgi:glycosyltransferase involved in cell wall biosynthesis
MNPPRRILHVIGRLDGYGGARMLRYLAADQAAAGNRVTVAALTAADGVADELRERGVAVQVVGSRWAVDPIAVGRVARLLRSAQADVVHAWDAASLLQACLRRSGSQQKLIATFDAEQASRRWAPRIVTTLRNRVDAFVAADEATRAWLEKQGTASERTHVIRTGVPQAARSAEDRASWLERLSLPTDAKVIMAAGPLVRRKQFDEVIWCFELVRVIYPEARLLIIGDGPDRSRLERFADDVSEPGCVRFLGYRSDIAELLPHADVYWQLDPSAGAPWALLETQAAGVPVVASDVPAHRAAVAPGETGLLAPLGNRAETARATDRLFRDKELAKRIGAAAAKLIEEQWPLDAALAAYHQLYGELLNPVAAG